MNLNKSQREAIRMMFGGRCAYCGIELTGKWHVDHVIPVGHGFEYRKDSDGRTKVIGTGKVRFPQHDTLGNMFPSCVPCNIDKAAIDLEGWREWLHGRIVNGLRRNSSTFRHAERFGRIRVIEEPLIFWFEKFAKEETHGS